MLEIIGKSGAKFVFNADHYDIPAADKKIYRLRAGKNEELLKHENSGVTGKLAQFNSLVFAAKDENSEWIEIDSEVLEGIEEKTKLTVINDFYFAVAKILWNPDELFIDAGSVNFIKLRLEIGVSHKPQFVVDFLMNRPEPSHLYFYRINIVKKLPRINRIEKLDRISLTAANILFTQLFHSCDGNIVINRQIVPFSAALTELFIDAINFEWQSKIVEELINAELGTL